jgi:RNA polymerase sigma-70 factor (ECF subfamily)
VKSELEQPYRELRPYAFAIACRILGSVSEAEDVVQDAFLRLSSARAVEIQSPTAYLATVTTRLAIDALRSARVQRESYYGPWLPEPLIDDHAVDATDPVKTSDSLTMAFRVVREELSPIERARSRLDHALFADPWSADALDQPQSAPR